jgi:hypothetical protein
VNGKSDLKAFDAKLEFDVELIPYIGDDSWIEPTIYKMKKTLMSDEIPPSGSGFGGGPCEFCAYRESAGNAFKKHITMVHEKNKKESIKETLF